MRFRSPFRRAVSLAVLLALSPAAPMPAVAAPASPGAVAPSSAGGSVRAPGAAADELPEWRWPVAGPRAVVEPFRAPAHEYGPGHRGVDIAAEPGVAVTAPADGVVAFRGTVVDRPLLTIDHGAGLVSTFEPLSSELASGTVVSAGDEIGRVDGGGHAAHGTLHLGVRLHGRYINPMLLFGEVPRAILLPCCAAL